MVLYFLQVIADHAVVPGPCRGINDTLHVLGTGKIGSIISKDGFIEWVIVS